ncbi:MAG: hypothetical protein AAF821_02030 [Cyanobacteria bacterium P01_D01_bin.156]
MGITKRFGLLLLLGIVGCQSTQTSYSSLRSVSPSLVDAARALWVRNDLIEITQADGSESLGADTTYVDAPVAYSETLEFAPGAYETSIHDRTVAQGTQHEYIFLAEPGQQLTVNLQAGEQNAVFQIYAEDTDYWMHLIGDYVGATATQWSGMLPKSNTGRYRIHIRPTWADAGYSMTVAIR